MTKRDRGPGSRCVDERVRVRALKVIADCGGSLTIASERLGISIPTLSRWGASELSSSRAGNRTSHHKAASAVVSVPENAQGE
jgi:hypothetical protein